MANVIDRYLAPQVHHRVPRVAAVVRVVAGVLFVVFGAPKFLEHERWVADFGTYGLPESSLMVYGLGLVEIVGGILLALAIALRPVAAVMTLVMVSAVILGGIIGGNPLSFTLAPLLLVSSAFVLWSTTAGARRAAAVR